MPEEQVDFAKQFAMLWKQKHIIVSITLIVTLIGLFLALTSPPVYKAEAVISLKDQPKNNTASSVLSQFGGLGGVVAAQLGIANTSLDKVEIILKSNELAENVIESNNLLPKLFPSRWDKNKSTWKNPDSNSIPTLREGADLLKASILSVSVDRARNVLEIGISIYDPKLAKDFVQYYMEALNHKLRDDAKQESSLNREFLQQQMTMTADPVLREKIQNMVSYEIEKEMLMASNSIQILEGPVVPLSRSKPNRKMILVLAFVAGLVLSITIIYAIPLAQKIVEYNANNLEVAFQGKERSA